MSTRVDSLLTLDPDVVEQEQALLAQQLQERLPSLDLRRGVLHDLLLHFSAILAAKNQTEQDRLRRSQSLPAILADPTLADDALVDNLAANFLVTRQAGTAAGGAVTIVVSALRDVSIAVGAVFDAQGQSFATEQVTTGRTSTTAVVAASDRLLIPRGDGTYEFQIRVTALATGTASQLRQGTALVPRVLPPNFVAAVVTEDFIGGLNAEDNADLVARLTAGLATKVVASRANMSATLQQQFPAVVHDSIIGFGDAELVRSRHALLPISLGNRADWYVQTQPLYRTYAAVKTATLVRQTGDGYGVWQLNFARDEYPGLYDVRVTPAGAQASLGEFPVDLLYRDLDLSALPESDGFVPDLVTAAEGAYSRFQTVSVQFKDTRTVATQLTPAVTTGDYAVTVRACPQLAEIQAYFLDRSVRNVAGDVLVKAPVPVFTRVAFTLCLLPGQSSPDLDALRSDLAQYVNTLGFLGQLAASGLLDRIHNHLPEDAYVRDLDLAGHLLYPDGGARWLRSSELLAVPYEPDRLVTSRTTLFFLDPADVAITLQTTELLRVL